LYDKGFIREPKGVVALRSWDMRRFGVLDGGLPAWIKEGYATEKRQEQLYEKVILLQISNRSCLKLKNRF
jgi:thiosulfate/3-mercaptopyruvate sulfurtransferase